MNADLILKNAVIFTMDKDRKILENGAVAVKNGIIEAVEADETGSWQAEEVIDCGGNILFPGFVDCMGDAGRTEEKAEADDPLKGWQTALQDLGRKSEDWWEKEGEREAEQALFLGITTVHRAMPVFVRPGCADAFQKSAARKGLRMVVSCGPDILAEESVFQAQMEITLKMLESPDRRLYIKRPLDGAAALFPRRLLPEAMPKEFELCRKRMEGMLKAVSDRTPLTAQMCGGELGLYGKAVPQLSGRPLMLYGMHGADLGEIDRMRREKYTYAHMPQTYLRTPLFLKMLSGGVPCAIAPGTANTRIPRDMLLAGRRAMLEEITAQDDYHYLPAGRVLELLTVDAAAVLGKEGQTGSIEAGKRADFGVLDWHNAHMTPKFMPVQAMVLRGYGQDIRTVVANGRVVKRDGRLAEGEEA